MKQQVVVTHFTHSNPLLQETEKKKLYPSSIDKHLSTFFTKIPRVTTINFFFGHNILAEGVFVTQLCGNAGISV
jgi:hypothetical protein